MYEALLNDYGGDFGNGLTVDKIVDLVEELPPMPNVVTRALRIIDDINSTADELADVIKLDPALALPIVRSANSVSMGQQQEVTSLDAAIMVVGMGQVKAVLLASAMRRWNRNFGPIERLVWEKSIGVAAGAKVVCDRRGKRYRDELYLTGLLHNLGQMVLLSHKDVGAAYPNVLARMKIMDEDFATAEREVIGFSHPLVGAMVAQKWGFPIGTCQSILRCNDPLAAVSGEKDEKLAVLKMAAGIALMLGIGRPEGYTFNPRAEVERLAALAGFGSDELQSELEQTGAETKSRFTADVGAFS